VHVRFAGTALAALLMLPAAARSETSDHVELGAGSVPVWGVSIAAGIVHGLSPVMGLTAHLEWSRRPWITGAATFDRRLALAGVGARLRLFPHQRFGNYVTAGVGVGHLTFPGEPVPGEWPAIPGEWHVVPWTGLGAEARLSDRLSIGAELRLQWFRRAVQTEGELPLQLVVRVPL
jgi:hypothetical protein